MTHIIIELAFYASLWIEMLVQGEVGRTTLAAALPGRMPRRPGPHMRVQVPPGLDRWEIVLRRVSKPGVCSSRAPYSAGGLRRQRASDDRFGA